MAADRKAIDKILKDAKLEVAESSPMIAVDNSEELLKLQAELRQSKERESELESQIAEAKEPTADAKPKKEKATKKK
jgi:oligoribonuclease (3'-5' exoribonuclease)